MVYTQKTFDIQQFFISKDVTSEAIDNICEFLLEPFSNVWKLNGVINTSVTLGWMSSDVLKVLPNAVNAQCLTQSEADEIAQCLNGEDIELIYLICLDAKIKYL